MWVNERRCSEGHPPGGKGGGKGGRKTVREGHAHVGNVNDNTIKEGPSKGRKTGCLRQKGF